MVIASPSSAGWLKPGDEDYPYTVYKTSEAFTRGWKQLEKGGYKLVRFETSKPKRKKSTQKYTVKVKGGDPLLGAFARPRRQGGRWTRVARGVAGRRER